MPCPDACIAGSPVASRRSSASERSLSASASTATTTRSPSPGATEIATTFVRTTATACRAVAPRSAALTTEEGGSS
jgi:hypothetical protein